MKDITNTTTPKLYCVENLVNTLSTDLQKT